MIKKLFFLLGLVCGVAGADTQYYLPSTNTLVAGTTFYVSSGTALSLNTSTLTFSGDGSTQTIAYPGTSGLILNTSVQESKTFNVSSGTIANFTGTNVSISSMTSTLPMSARKITGLAAAGAAGDAVRYEQLFNAGTVTLLGPVAFNPTTAGVVGTPTNDSATAGNVGEYVSSTFNGVASPTSTNYGDATSIVLTGGDWDVTLQAWTNTNGVTTSIMHLGIGTTTGNSSAGISDGDTGLYTSGTTNLPITIAAVRKSLPPGSTTLYAKIQATYSGTSPQWTGRFSARRVR